MNSIAQVRVAEYGQVEGETWSKPTVLESRRHNNRLYTPVHRSAGWECAGSMARMLECEVWCVNFNSDSAIHGRRFLVEAEARECFDSWTQDVHTTCTTARKAVQA